MTDIEQKALALVNGMFLDPYYKDWSQVPQGHLSRALCRSIQLHEATKQEFDDFKQKVSDAAQEYEEAGYCMGWEGFERFIIPKPKPDPLEDVLDKMLRRRFLDPLPDVLADEAHWLRAALDALGFEIRKKNK